MTPAERQAARDLRADVLALAAREAGRRHRDPFEVAWGVTSQTEEWLGRLANRARYEGFGEDCASAPGPEAPATDYEHRHACHDGNRDPDCQECQAPPTEDEAAEVLTDMQATQRALDNTPCRACGGDRLRPDYRTPGQPCHAPWGEVPR